ncbi:acid protease [Aaosphaeria arxii CBS 175.79]|uniref:Acid protease n=1 Tax=Aaosphaeria arxii CBS 175.79 TaxID=1450172 RepID=A0A6A5X8P8_9PLEO|nr:acid protease [Aaosphaeria arxii CBS 175.79]KAF2009435.1 acid protease [Aaosphaeria arxii CBS 175.79]
MTNVSLASQSYTLVIDTGSSDTWVASTRFRCLSPSTRRRLPQSSCGFGKLFNISDSPTFETIPTHDFSVQYTDGEYLLGEMGTEELEVGGWRTRQTIGVVERGWWIGDGLSSGLMGLAYPTLASGVNDLNYTSIAFTLFEDGTVPSIFSLALSRPSVDNPVAGGLLAIGGIPDIPLDGDFVSVPIQPIISDQYAFYSVPVDGIAVTPPEGWIPPTRRRQRKTRPFHRPLHRQTTNNQTHIFHLTSSRAHQNPQADPGSSSEDSGLEMIIDSGTTLIYVPWDIAAAIGSFFVPPAIFNETSNLWIVHCDAALPDIGVIIGGKLLKIDPRDLIGPGGGTMVTKNHDGVAGGVTKTQMCVPSIQGRVSGDSVLGDAFLKSVVAVFDVGVNEMRFAQRAPY